jgi:FKBP-type peptidyl-prolyl cis-trans isomerase
LENFKIGRVQALALWPAFLCASSPFAPSSSQWDNARMRKPLIISAIIWAAGFLPATALAQQTPPANNQQTPAAGAQQTPAPKAQKAPAAKTGQSSAAKSSAVLTLKTQKDKVSYAIGSNIGKSLRKDSGAYAERLLQTPEFLAWEKDALADRKSLLTDEEIKATMVALQNDLRKKQEEKIQALAQNNQKEGESFLAANKTKEGVITLPSGLQYKVLQEGTGPKPSASDSVVCNYRGTFLDNTEFDSSYKRGQPATFPVTGVIKGWTEALQLMAVGSKWQLFVPSDLAYGPRGRGPMIGPNATLIFEVELLSIQPKPGEQTKPLDKQP